MFSPWMIGTRPVLCKQHERLSDLCCVIKAERGVARKLLARFIAVFFINGHVPYCCVYVVELASQLGAGASLSLLPQTRLDGAVNCTSAPSHAEAMNGWMDKGGGVRAGKASIRALNGGPVRCFIFKVLEDT